MGSGLNDSISRQAAIDEIARWIGYLDDDMIGRIQLGLKRLPSAQPEIIYCKDCANAPKCFGDVIMKTRSGANLYCPLTYCSEGKRKNE